MQECVHPKQHQFVKGFLNNLVIESNKKKINYKNDLHCISFLIDQPKQH